MTATTAPAGTTVGIQLVVRQGHDTVLDRLAVVVYAYPIVAQADGTAAVPRPLPRQPFSGALTRVSVTTDWPFGEDGYARRFTVSAEEDYGHQLNEGTLNAMRTALISVASAHPELAPLIAYPTERFLATSK